MKKRVIILMLATLLIGGALSACSSNEETNSTITTDTNEDSTITGTSNEEVANTDTEAPTSEDSTSQVETDSSTDADSSKNENTSNEQKPSDEQKPSTGQKPNEEQKPSDEQKPGQEQPPIDEPETETMPAVKEMVDEMLEEVKQPRLAEMESNTMQDAYGIDPQLLEAFSIRFSMINVKSNEIALFKVKNETDIDTVKEGITNRAENIQKQFEMYLPDQYENAKNYRIITKGNYVLFIISESADDLEKAFTAFFEKQ